MSRILLFIVLVVAFAVGIGYRLMHGTSESVTAPVAADASSPIPSMPAESPAPFETVVQSAEDDEIEKTISVDEQKFESEDETEDTDDSLTIEVEEGE